MVGLLFDQIALDLIHLSITVNIQEVVLVQVVEVVVPCHTSGFELSNSREGRLNIIQSMLGPLDVGSNVVRCAPDELRLVGEPVDMYTILSISILLEFFHHNLGRTQPPDLHEVGLPGISPKPYLLTQVVLGVKAFVLCSKCPAKSLVSIGLDHGLLGGTATSESQLEILMATKVHGLEGIREETAGQLRLVAQDLL